MKLFFRYAPLVATGLLATVLVTGVLVPWLRGSAPLGSDLREISRIFLDDWKQREAIIARQRVLLRVLDEKDQAVRELIAGRLAMPEAVERFRELNCLMDDGNDEILGSYDIVVDERRTCERITSWVWAALRNDPQRVREVLSRLEAEMRQHRQRTG